ncbi:MAG TPA: glycine betaine ABC transporter ATP-binding protein [Candidatus Atribacteria bacterium]|jgi:osmoprotectant transport system ATP-binding protein|nr:glycine betaine ABC transporter ATP-binding protein [Candidatus Atribacteria bacterium]
MIKFEKVRKIYSDGTEAIKGISFEVEKGEFCILLGPSGCGKTTTMKMINRLIPISEGKIYINGQDNTKIDENKLRRGIGYAIQQIGLFPHMTVKENIQTVPVLREWPKEKIEKRVKELMYLIGLDPSIYLKKYPAELSGGEMQRIGVARCLGADPPILLMDEPFGSIDPINRGKLQDEFLKIQAKIKKTIIFVTHDIDEAIKMGDKIVLMKEGEIVDYDTPSNLLYRPKNEFVRNFVGTDRALKGLQLMRVKEIMDSSPKIVRADEEITEAKSYMEQEKIRWLIVVDDNHRFIGWLGRADLDNKKVKEVRDIMIPPTVSATAETPLNEALSLMLSSAVGNLAIVDDKNKLEGIVDFNSIRSVLEKIYNSREGQK